MTKRVVQEPVGGGDSDEQVLKSKNLLALERKNGIAKVIEASFANCVRRGVDDNGERHTVGSAQSAAYHQLRGEVQDLNVKDWIGNGKQTLKTLFDRHDVKNVVWPPGKGDVDVDMLQRAVQEIFAAQIREAENDSDKAAQLRVTMSIHQRIIQIAKHSFDLSKKKKKSGEKKKYVSPGVQRQRQLVSEAVENSNLGPIKTAFTRSKGEAENARKEKKIAAQVAPPPKKIKQAHDDDEEEWKEEEQEELEKLEEDELDLGFEPMNIPTTDDKGDAEASTKKKKGGEGGAGGQGTKGRRRLSDAKEENRMLEYVKEKQRAELEKEAAETARRAAQFEFEARERKLDRELRMEELSLERERLRLKAETDRQELELRKQREQQEQEFKKQQLQMQLDLQNKLLEVLAKK